METPERSQYHHFIPRFILRGFEDIVQPPTATAASLSKAKQKKQQRRNAVLKLIRTSDGGWTSQRVARQYGLVDMYRDETAPHQHALEVKLSKLETQVGHIFAKARTAFSQASSTLTLSRAEKDTLRKFLFLMKYRGSHMYSRFNVGTIEEYKADDKIKMKAYMEEKGFGTPRDVWLANLHGFLDITIDPGKGWRRTIMQQVYSDDALLFILHVSQSFMAFCKPRSPDDEYLLTENVFGIFEGPSGHGINILTGERERGFWTEWHNFAPVSASLLIVLRSYYLPGGVVEANDEMRNKHYRTMLNMHVDPTRATSMLQDLPVTKCETSYTNVQDGKATPVAGFSDYSPSDCFTFKCFELGSAHVNTINGIFLEEGVGSGALTYKNSAPAAKAIKHYLEDPRPGFKLIDEDDSPRMLYLRALERALKTLGDTAHVVFKRLMLPTLTTHPSDYGGHMARWVGFVVATEIYIKYPRLLGYYGSLARGKLSHQSRQGQRLTACRRRQSSVHVRR